MSDAGGQTTTILVDDESDIRLMVRILLESSGDFVVIAEGADGSDAVEIVSRVAPSAPDVVLLDNRMPKMSGLEAARAILAENADTKIVLFSAFVDDQVIAEAEQIGIRSVLRKTDFDDLPRVLSEIARTA